MGKKGKKLTHPQKRLAERTRLKKGDLRKVNNAVLAAKGLPKGVNHAAMGLEGYAVIKTVGKGKKRHVVASVLGRGMKPPGRDVSGLLHKYMKPKEASKRLAFIEKIGNHPAAEVLRKVYIRKKKKYPKGRNPSTPHDEEYLKKVLSGDHGEMTSSTTPLSDLIAGRRLPLKQGGPESK